MKGIPGNFQWYSKNSPGFSVKKSSRPKDGCFPVPEINIWDEIFLKSVQDKNLLRGEDKSGSNAAKKNLRKERTARCLPRKEKKTSNENQGKKKRVRIFLRHVFAGGLFGSPHQPVFGVLSVSFGRIAV